jgi:hypothetical protein
LNGTITSFLPVVPSAVSRGSINVPCAVVSVLPQISATSIGAILTLPRVGFAISNVQFAPELLIKYERLKSSPNSNSGKYSTAIP